MYKHFFSKFMKAQKLLNANKALFSDADFKEAKALLSALQTSFADYAAGRGTRECMMIDLDMWTNFGIPIIQEAKESHLWGLWCKGRRNAEPTDAFYGISGPKRGTDWHPCC